MIQVRFDSPKNGWLLMEIAADGQTFSFWASYIGGDFLTLLVDSLNTYLNGRKAEVDLYEEPQTYRFAFTSKSGEDIFRIRSFADELEARKEYGRSKLVLEVMMSRVDLALVFWRALREIEGRIGKEIFDTHWVGFPSKKVELLGQKIKAMRK